MIGKIFDALFGNPDGHDDIEPETVDPRDMVGQNETGRPRRSSAGKRRQAHRKMYRDTKWESK